MFSLRFAGLGSLLMMLAALAFSAPERTSYLGVGVIGIDEQIAHELNWGGAGGLFVTVVLADSPAEKAGLQPDDIIVAFNGKPLRDPGELGSLVAALPPGRKIHLQVFRGGRTTHISAVLSAREPRPGPEPLIRFDLPTADSFFTDMPSPALRWRNSLIGIEYEGVDSQLGEFFGVKQGVLIRFVQPGSAGNEGGLQAGDVVTKVNGKVVTNPRDFALDLQNREQRKPHVAMAIIRDHKERAIKINLARADSSISPRMHPATVPLPR